MNENVKEKFEGLGIEFTEDGSMKFDIGAFDELQTAMEAELKREARLAFDRLGDEIHQTNVEKGFWDRPVMMDKYVAKLALIHSELTEVLEALRKSQGADKVTEEFADVLIRTFDLYATLVAAGEADPELFGVMQDKMETNKNRAPKHGNRWG